MAGLVAVIYGVVAYGFTLVALLYLIGFVGNLIVPKSIDSGTAGPLVQSMVVDVMLIALFATQHSVMARQGFKRWWTRIVPPSVERSTYVLFTSFVLLILYWQWRPIPAPVWTVQDPIAAGVIDGIFWLGWVVLVASTFMLSHFELFGLSQVFARLFGKQLSDAKFRTPLLYRHVRHPIYLGVLLAVWATPAMTAGHLLFALVITGYILIGIQLEEHDLIQQFGDRYRHYRQHAAMLVPLPGRKFTDAKDADV
ncbi:MAG: isoprenylcysteine carboxylmethyltransferase family protein [Xanthobacteraceae bacterium]|nr:isoprenylcysteine carboxylmethyltransferase family protein [Xanthobacteraceae bacterium]